MILQVGKCFNSFIDKITKPKVNPVKKKKKVQAAGQNGLRV